jgi:hypothetical protein
MNTEDRKQVRDALIALGADRRGFTMDSGDGVYSEVWRLPKNGGYVTVEWAPKEDHVTKTNPSGEVRQCDRRDIHEAHEWQAGFGDHFNVYCPGNDGTIR